MNILSAMKPYGLTTHSSGGELDGFVEFLERRSNEKLYVCHRLDKTTTGIQLFARDKESAQELTRKFENHEMHKTYFFLTDKTAREKTLTQKSHIEKTGNEFVSHLEKPNNSETEFVWQKSLGAYELWKALPKSGKPHQIRLHAEDLGIPILGDTKHRGSPFAFLCLHAQSIQFDDQFFQAEMPYYLEFPELLAEPDAALALLGMQRRFWLYSSEEPSLRLLHADHPWLRCDQLGDVLWFQSFHTDWQYSQKITMKVLEVLAKKLHRTHEYHIVHMKNRGDNPLETNMASSLNCPLKWTCHENSYSFEIRRDQGMSSGIFLDQRQNRKWVLANAQQKEVLNLFSYTGVFSVAAAVGGAKAIDTVDTSKATIEWARNNFSLQRLEKDTYKFWSTDARLFLKGARNKNRQYDLIICDPPSFARSKEKTFRIEKEFFPLLDEMITCLAPKGRILFCTNYEKWTYTDLKSEIEMKYRKKLQVLHPPRADWDFEFPGDNPILKTYLLELKS